MLRLRVIRDAIKHSSKRYRKRKVVCRTALPYTPYAVKYVNNPATGKLHRVKVWG